MLKINSKNMLSGITLVALIAAGCADGSRDKKVRIPLRNVPSKAGQTGPQGPQQSQIPEIVTPAGEAAKEAEYEKARSELDQGTAIRVADLMEGSYVVDSMATELRINKTQTSFFGILQTFQKSEGDNLFQTLVRGSIFLYGEAVNELDSAVTLNFAGTFSVATNAGATEISHVKSSGITMKASFEDPRSGAKDVSTFSGEGKISVLDLLMSADDPGQTILTSKKVNSALGLQAEGKIMKLSDTRVRLLITVYKDAKKLVARNLFVTYTVTPTAKNSSGATDSKGPESEAGPTGQSQKAADQSMADDALMTGDALAADSAVTNDMGADSSADPLSGMTLEVGDAVKN